MKTLDYKKIGKVDIKNLMDSAPNLPIEKSRVECPYAEQKEGIIKMVKDPCQGEAEFKTLQEQHNANHALYYLSMMTDAVISGRSTGKDEIKIKRLEEHTMNLREFIKEDKTELKEAVRMLLENLRHDIPVGRKAFALFALQNWKWISLFAKEYGHQERCFSDGKHQKLYDVVSLKCYFRAWWWKQMLEKGAKRFNRLVRFIQKYFSERTGR